MARPLGKSTIYIIRAPLVRDPRDNSFYRDWASATETEVRYCMVEPYPMAEKLNVDDNRDREFVQTAVRMFVPPKTDVVYTDRIRWDDHLFNVLGAPFTWQDFRDKRVWKAVIAQYRMG
jgi:head-tail adaptor